MPDDLLKKGTKIWQNIIRDQLGTLVPPPLKYVTSYLLPVGICLLQKVRLLKIFLLLYKEVYNTRKTYMYVFCSFDNTVPAA
jgi:hypothetical protein